MTKRKRKPSGILSSDLPYIPKRKKKKKAKVASSAGLTKNELTDLVKILVRDNLSLAATLGYNYRDVLQQRFTEPSTENRTLLTLEQDGDTQ